LQIFERSSLYRTDDHVAKIEMKWALFTDRMLRPWRRSQLFCAWFVGIVFLTGIAAESLAPSGSALPAIEVFMRLFPDPQDVSGWKVDRQAVANTTEMKRAVAELLDYDAGSFVVYSKADLRISIYAAYWRSGKISPRLIASHTPDVCWVSSGWACQMTGSVDLETSKGRNLRVKHRVFTAPNGSAEHVVFCHVVGGRARDYSQHGEPVWYALLSEIRRNGLELREEQLFFRISSNQPLNEFMHTAPVRAFMSRVSSFLHTAKSDG
jgi:hypothetical protein